MKLSKIRDEEIENCAEWIVENCYDEEGLRVTMAYFLAERYKLPENREEFLQDFEIYKKGKEEL